MGSGRRNRRAKAARDLPLKRAAEEAVLVKQGLEDGEELYAPTSKFMSLVQRATDCEHLRNEVKSLEKLHALGLFESVSRLSRADAARVSECFTYLDADKVVMTRTFALSMGIKVPLELTDRKEHKSHIWRRLALLRFMILSKLPGQQLLAAEIRCPTQPTTQVVTSLVAFLMGACADNGEQPLNVAFTLSLLCQVAGTESLNVFGESIPVDVVLESFKDLPCKILESYPDESCLDFSQRRRMRRRILELFELWGLVRPPGAADVWRTCRDIAGTENPGDDFRLDLVRNYLLLPTHRFLVRVVRVDGSQSLESVSVRHMEWKGGNSWYAPVAEFIRACAVVCDCDWQRLVLTGLDASRGLYFFAPSEPIDRLGETGRLVVYEVDDVGAFSPWIARQPRWRRSLFLSDDERIVGHDAAPLLNVGGTYYGEYNCAGAQRACRLEVTDVTVLPTEETKGEPGEPKKFPSAEIGLVFDFVTRSGAQAAYALEGTYDGATREARFEPLRWIVRTDQQAVTMVPITLKVVGGDDTGNPRLVGCVDKCGGIAAWAAGDRHDPLEDCIPSDDEEDEDARYPQLASHVGIVLDHSIGHRLRGIPMLHTVPRSLKPIPAIHMLRQRYEGRDDWSTFRLCREDPDGTVPTTAWGDDPMLPSSDLIKRCAEYMRMQWRDAAACDAHKLDVVEDRTRVNSDRVRRLLASHSPHAVLEDCRLDPPLRLRDVLARFRHTPALIDPPDPTRCVVCFGHAKEGSNRVCGACGTVRYCGRECQRAHWDGGHKESCSRRRQRRDKIARRLCDVCGRQADLDGPRLPTCSACDLRRYCDESCQAADWAAGHRSNCPRTAGDC